MLVNGLSLLEGARSGGTAIAACNIYNLEGVRAAVFAAEHCRRPIILQVGVGALAFAKTGGLSAAIVDAAREASVAVGFQLDHARTLDDVETAARAGCTSVMFDASDHPFEENTAAVACAVGVARRYGLAIEAELGRTAGAEDFDSGSLPDEAKTNPEAAHRFVKLTSADALAVNIGNVHGLWQGEPRLDFARLAQIRQAVSVPLVLHGASGISDASLVQSVALGITKVNFNTELRRVYLETIQGYSVDRSYNLLALLEQTSAAMQRIIEEKITVLTRSVKTEHD